MPIFKFDPSDNVIVLEAKIFGSLVTTARLVFDTGATLTMIPWKLATAIDLKIDPEKTVQTSTASTIESSPLVLVPKMSILGEEVKNVEALVKDLPPQAGVDGLLGLNFIKHFQVLIDFKKGELRLER